LSKGSSWEQRVRKAVGYLRRGEFGELTDEARRFWAWTRARRLSILATSGDHIAAEAAFWDQCEVDLVRKASWASAADFGSWAFRDMCEGKWPSIMDLIIDLIEVPQTQPLRGLVLGCGDMAGEHTMFVDPRLKFAEVDAYDVSPESIERARKLTDEKGLVVNYYAADVNRIALRADRYALVVINHSYHHFEQVDHVTQQINRSLLPGGLFSTVDYIGPRRLQFTDRQMFYAQLVLEALPLKQRHELDGSIKERIHRISPNSISPDEASHSDQILPAMARYMRVLWQQNWAGLLYPLLQGIGYNFDTTKCEDLALLKFLYDLDRVLCQSGEVEPNFTITVATKK
jgi:SAM-dependent methyltransferase